MQILTKVMLLVAVLAGFSLVTVSGFNGLAMAANTDQVCDGVNLGSGGSCDDGGEVNKVIGTIIDILSWVVGVVSVIMIIIAGFQFVTAGGDPQKAAKARSTILYAIVGIVVVAFAQVIVRFVLKKLS